MEILVVGLNHRTAPVELREQVAFSSGEAQAACERLRSLGILEESVILSTCNRSEIYGVASESAVDTSVEVANFFATYHQVSTTNLRNAVYHHIGEKAIQHLYRVAAGLDSMLLGEAEVLGQVRDAYQSALEHGSTGRVLNRLFQRALEVGKRVRTETGLGVRPVSVAFAGVKLAEQILGQLAGKKALILGAGGTSERVVGHLRDRGLKHLRLINRTTKHAEGLAAKFAGEVIPWEHLSGALEWPDVIVSSVSLSEPILTRELLEQAKSSRENRPLLVIDLGLPRNVAPSAGTLKDVYVYNIDDLTLIVEQNKKAREAEVPHAEAIIQQQLQKFVQWHAEAACAAVSASAQISAVSRTFAT